MISRWLIVVCCCAFFLIPFPAAGQHYVIKNYSTGEGLAQSQIQTLFQDSSGYLWVGTVGGGVSRFDGIAFTNFTEKDGLTNNHVWSICEDASGTLWFGTDKGTSLYDGTTFFPINVDNSLSRAVIRAIVRDKKGNLWFAAGKELWQYDGSQYTCLDKKEGFPGEEIFALAVDGQGNVWLGTDSGRVSRYNGSSFTHLYPFENVVSNIVYCIMVDRLGKLWFGTQAGAASYDGKQFRRFTKADGLRSLVTRAIIEDRDGNIWFGSDGGGVCSFNGRDFTFITDKNGLNSNVVWALLEDRESNIWIGTSRGGLDQYSGSMFTLFSTSEGSGDDLIRDVLVDSRGNTWFASSRGGVSKYDGQSITNYKTRDGLTNDFVLTIAEDKNGTLWFGTYGGACRFNGKRFEPFSTGKKSGLSGRLVKVIHQDRAGNTWFGTDKNGIYRYDGKEMTAFSTADGLPDNRITTLLEDRQGQMWIGTMSGVCCYRGGVLSDMSEVLGLRQKSVFSIIEDEKGSIWFGIYGDGVLRYSPDGFIAPKNPNQKINNHTSQELKPTIVNASIVSFNTRDGLLDDNVVSLIFDNKGELWIGTEKGVCRLDIENFENNAKKVFKHYGKAEKFPGIECIQNAVSKDNNGNIWFGTIKGAVKYNPAWDRPNEIEPVTHITGLDLFFGEEPRHEHLDRLGLQSGFDGSMSLTYVKNYLEFTFIGLSFTAPAKVNYLYKLEGFDSFWIQAGTRQFANYHNLPPGDYVFKVKSCNNEGLWNQKPTVFRFKIVPPFWMKWWFVWLCGCLGAVAIYGFVKFRVRNLQKHKRILAEQVKIATAELEKEKEKVEKINLELEDRVQERTAELRESEEKFRLVVENANDAVFIVQNEKITFPNPKTVELLGYNQEELAETNLIKLIHPEDRIAFIAQHHDHLDDQRRLPHTGFSYSSRLLDKQGRELWVDIHTVPIDWEEKPAALYFFRDITEKKKLEAQLLQAQKMEALGTMAGGIAHDFNNLLMGILGNITMVLTSLRQGAPFYTELKNAETYIKSGATLTRQLLGLARGGKYEVIAADLNQVIRSSAEMFGHTRREITIHAKYEPNLWVVEVDRGQFEQVLVNLFVNAWQAMPGGGSIYIQTRNLNLDANHAAKYNLTQGRYVEVSVTDTGTGMDEETRQRIFEPFFTTKKMGRGIGLGLASVYGIVTNHGGIIQVDSEKGKGTTFTIVFPASDKAIVKEEKLPERYLTGNGEIILLIDDEEMIRDVGESYAEELKYKCILAGSGQEAIEIFQARKEEIDLVILDIIMPVMGGKETYQQLKKLDPMVRVLIASGYSLDSDAEEMLKDGCLGFIEKPYSLEEFSVKVRSALEHNM